MVVKGDLSTAEQYIEVVDKETPVFVADVDGTLTTSADAELVALLAGSLPDANANASQALHLLVQKGYRPFYLTARPETLVARTRAFLDQNGFPPGIVHTTLTLTGATGDGAAAYKTTDLQWLASKGLEPSFAFGDQTSDAQAYENAGIMLVSDRYFFGLVDSYGGTEIQNYSELLGPFGRLAEACPSSESKP